MLLLALALLAVVSLLVLLVVACGGDELVGRLTRRYAAWRDRRREGRLIARLDRAVEADVSGRDVHPEDLDRAQRRPLEEIAADLRRLGRQRIAAGGRAAVWHTTVVEAYDERLRLACRALGLTEHLGELAGVDLQIERIRVEGILHAAGLVLPAAQTGQWQRHR
ncbi:hypothetical protein GA0070616_3018 [Micromonospora nigra]|uniref:Uncharacterized protein n=1 Tax=Micromonospora nigra TaxID=145857 RepID=A0A1C6S6R6_9ACTN|nr:hypothetical protein GA0070616_3018 [Micromonospora nigra]